MLKVLYIHHSGGRGGSSNSLFNLLKNLPDEEVDKHIITVGGPVVNLFSSITQNLHVVKSIPFVGTTSGVDNLPLRNLFGLVNYFKEKKNIERLLLKIKPDIIHLNEVTSVQVAKIAKRLGIKVVCHIRIVPDGNYSQINNFVKRQLKRYVDEIVCIDGSVANHYSEFSNLNIVYNIFHMSTPTSIAEHHSEQINCIFLSNLLRHKGIYDLLHAVKSLNNNKNISFYIVGGNTKSETFFKSFLGRILVKLKVHVDLEKVLMDEKENHGLSNLHILGHQNNIEQILSQAHLLLFPSYMNGPSRSVFEAGMYGIPSIIALKDKIQDVVTDGFNGFIIDEGDHKKLAKCIETLANDHELRNSMGVNARNRFLSLNDGDKAKMQILYIYNSLFDVKQ